MTGRRTLDVGLHGPRLEILLTVDMSLPSPSETAIETEPANRSVASGDGAAQGGTPQVPLKACGVALLGTTSTGAAGASAESGADEALVYLQLADASQRSRRSPPHVGSTNPSAPPAAPMAPPVVPGLPRLEIVARGAPPVLPRRGPVARAAAEGRGNGGSGGNATGDGGGAQGRGPGGDVHELRIFVDHSIIEVFMDGGLAVVTTRSYPAAFPDAPVAAVSLGSTGCTFLSATVWKLRATDGFSQGPAATARD